MTNEDGSLQIVYNGEIFNHAVRPELERAGHIYVTHCDTETILHAYEEYGPDCLERFRGMFAFAFWDRTRRTSFLRPRPSGHQTVLLLLGRTAVCLRVGDQGAAAAPGDFARFLKKLLSPNIWPSDTPAANRRCFPAFAS